MWGCKNNKPRILADMVAYLNLNSKDFFSAVVWCFFFREPSASPTIWWLWFSPIVSFCGVRRINFTQVDNCSQSPCTANDITETDDDDDNNDDEGAISRGFLSPNCHWSVNPRFKARLLIPSIRKRDVRIGSAMSIGQAETYLAFVAWERFSVPKRWSWCLCFGFQGNATLHLYPHFQPLLDFPGKSCLAVHCAF